MIEITANSERERKRRRMRQLFHDRLRVALMLLCMLSLILEVVGSMTNSWSYQTDGDNKGLWQVCDRQGSCRFMEWNRMPRWLFACQALFVVSQLLTLVVFV